MEANLDQLKSQYLQTEISAGAKLRITQTLNSIEDTPRDVRNRNVFDWRNLSQVSSWNPKKIAIAAVVVIACATVLAFGVPQKAYAMLQSVFSHFSKESGLNDNYDKFAIPINATASNSGIHCRYRGNYELSSTLQKNFVMTCLLTLLSTSVIITTNVKTKQRRELNV